MASVIASTYELIEKIGSGGGGTVYLANHLRLGKKVILKADKRKITARPELLRREVDILKELNHSYIPQVYDFFVEDETVYTVMDYIEGESLDKPLKRGERFPQAQVIRWARQLLEALDYLHSPTHGDPPRGYVHSDIKPANIMRTPYNDICLIDFNIALALGEENVVGCSAGYASPEHYGLDYSSFSNDTVTIGNDETVTLLDETATLTLSNAKSSVSTKRVVPDVRSDIYSLGATLYHLLSGQKPAKNAMEVLPLSDKEFSPQVTRIIAKAMNPNPNLRYQTASEMLDALNHLYENDPRTKRLKRANMIAGILISAMLIVGGAMTFIGLRQMERAQAVLAQEERQAKEAEAAAKAALAAVRKSEAARAKGDLPGARAFALSALTENTPYLAQGQKALTDALGVYDLSDGLKAYCTAELPSEALKLSVSPEGSWVAVLYAYSIVLLDTKSGGILAEFPTQNTAVSDFVFLDETTFLYAGENGLVAYDIPNKKTLWTGEKVTRLAVSEDGTRVVGIYERDSNALLYDVVTGEKLNSINLGGRRLDMPAGNGILADPEDTLLILNKDGTLMAASFEGGGLALLDTQSGEIYEIMDSSDYEHFEGGFSGEYFAFSAWDGSNDALFLIYDMETMTQLGGFSGSTPFHTSSDSQGICLAQDNLLVEIDAETLEQREMAYTATDIIAFQRRQDGLVLVTTKDNGYTLFNENAQLIARGERESGCELIGTGGLYVVLASLETPTMQILKLETHVEAQLAVYDPALSHNEARLSADGNRVMLFTFDTAYILDTGGNLLQAVDMPDAELVYDQQYRRDETGSYLEVTWHDGTQRAYSADNGSLLWEKHDAVVDESLQETFETSLWRIEAPLHGAAMVYDRESGKKIAELEPDSFLTYVTEVGNNLVTQYITARGERYGLLLNQDCETLAYLPGLCDVLTDGLLVFDDDMGNLRQSRIYSLQELKALANNQ